MSFAKSLREKAEKVWEDGYHHPFVQELGKGILPREKFQFYLMQDYQYLLSYAKIFALGVVKADTEELMARFSAAQDGILNHEMELHRTYMKDFGIAPEVYGAVRPSLWNRAYTANMLAVGQTGGAAEILATVFPCAWTYGDYARRLAAEYQDVLPENPYRSWIEMYAGEEFLESYEWFFEALNRLCEEKSGSEKRKLEEIFTASIEFEYLFWDMSYHCRMSYSV